MELFGRPVIEKDLGLPDPATVLRPAGIIIHSYELIGERSGFKNIRVFCRLHGLDGYVSGWVSGEMWEDKPALDNFTKSCLLDLDKAS